MKNRWILLKVVTGITFAVLPSLGGDCESLGQLTLPATTLTAAQAVPAGSFSPPTGTPLKNLPSFCRVAGMIKLSNDSHIQFEIWMPSSGWNGKFQGIGNGGFAGAIEYNGLADAVQHGYAAASTDTGKLLIHLWCRSPVEFSGCREVARQ
jgi:feruloyl esterase